MSDIKVKTIGELIDSLVTTNIRCWMHQENLMNESFTAEQRLKFAVMAQEQNAKRSQLIGAINDLLGEEGFTSTKTYTYFEDKK